MGGGARPDGSGELPAPPELRVAPGYVVRRLYQAYTAAWVRQVDATLTGPQFAVLTAVSAHPGAEQGSLARAVALDRSTMASIVRRLEDRRLISRETPAEDGRKRLLYLTESGVATLRTAGRRVHEMEARLMDGCDPDRAGTLVRELTALSEHWERLAAD